MAKIVIVQFVSCEGPGYLGDFFNAGQIPFSVCDLEAGQRLPTSIDRVSGLVFMGGPMSVNDSLSWVAPCLDLIRTATGAGVPLLGHCLGAQLIARACGATVRRNPIGEFGWHPVDRLTGPAVPAWCETIPTRFEAFHWHGETFDLPSGAIRLFSSQACTNQGFALGTAIGLQFHVEIGREMIEDWIGRYAGELEPPGPAIQAPLGMTQDLDRRLDRCRAVADQVYGHWVEQVLAAT